MSNKIISCVETVNKTAELYQVKRRHAVAAVNSCKEAAEYINCIYAFKYFGAASVIALHEGEVVIQIMRVELGFEKSGWAHEKTMTFNIYFHPKSMKYFLRDLNLVRFERVDV